MATATPKIIPEDTSSSIISLVSTINTQIDEVTELLKSDIHKASKDNGTVTDIDKATALLDILDNLKKTTDGIDVDKLKADDINHIAKVKRTLWYISKGLALIILLFSVGGGVVYGLIYAILMGPIYVLYFALILIVPSGSVYGIYKNIDKIRDYFNKTGINPPEIGAELTVFYTKKPNDNGYYVNDYNISDISTPLTSSKNKVDTFLNNFMNGFDKDYKLLIKRDKLLYDPIKTAPQLGGKIRKSNRYRKRRTKKPIPKGSSKTRKLKDIKKKIV
jgi:hypothetical protein